MIYNVLIGGAAGQGMETISGILEKILKRYGYHVFAIKDYMSRVRGGHNFTRIRFADQEISSHQDSLDVILALNDETITIHIKNLKDNGVIICSEETAAATGIKDNRILPRPLQKMAAEAGNKKTAGSSALGALVKLFGMEADNARKTVQEFFVAKYAKENLSAFTMGYESVDVKFTPIPRKDDNKILINGNQAVALGAIAGGCKFYSAYPMTPSTSIMNYLAAKMQEAKIVVEQAEDEIAAINMALGASYAGARAMTGTSGGGFALMVEGLGLSGMMELPLVIAEIQRPGPVTGFPTRTEQSDLKFVISASQGEFPRMVIALKNPEDAFYQTVRAFNLADKYQIPVILLGDQFLADYTVSVKPFDLSKVKTDRYLTDTAEYRDREYRKYEITETGISPRIIPGKMPGTYVEVDSDEHDEAGHITESAEIKVKMTDKRMRKLSYLSKDDLIEPEFFGAEDFAVLLVAWGSLHGPVQEAVAMLNREQSSSGSPLKYAALIFGDIWPFPAKTLHRIAPGAKEIINVEQNATGQLAALMMENTGIKCGKSILKYDGRPISALEICERAVSL